MTRTKMYDTHEHRRLALLACVFAGLAGCAVVKLPVKAAGTVVGHTILAVTQDAHRPATLPLDAR